MTGRKIIAAAALALTASLAACGTQPHAGRPCSGPYSPVIASGGYLRVTADGHGTRSDAAHSNYRCDNDRLTQTAPVR
jgi:hypothetical protein